MNLAFDSDVLTKCQRKKWLSYELVSLTIQSIWFETESKLMLGLIHCLLLRGLISTH